jgi:protein-S-isoprenylcysteine O-methyltransferase Ste14
MHLLLVLAIVAAVLLVRRMPSLHALQWAVFQSLPLAITGAIFMTLGAVLAFAARAVIGRNWGSPAARKSDTELVTGGPYKIIRHPIYSGLLLMMAGTSIGLSPAWWLVVVVASVYFLRSARSEEEFMTERFPDQYPTYRAHTKMLIPWVL